MKCFSSGELGGIARRTNNNNHTENYLFIAKKIKSPLAPELERMVKKRDRGLGINATHQYRLYDLLMKELKQKCPDYEAVYSRL